MAIKEPVAFSSVEATEDEATIELLLLLHGKGWTKGQILSYLTQRLDDVERDLHLHTNFVAV